MARILPFSRVLANDFLTRYGPPMRPILPIFLAAATLLLLTGWDEEDLQREQVSQREDIRLLKEKLSQVQNDTRAFQAELAKLRTELAALQELRKDIERLDGLVQKLDAAREQDHKTIIEEVGREIARLNKAASGGGKPKTPKTPDKPPATEVGVEHVVKKGEYLAIIAEAYGVSVQAIKDANQLKSNELKVGQKLFIPSKK